jgi:glycosyltransferase involved in cell wall biosynthesis
MTRRDKIVIVTGAHLCRNPRVVKEATTLGAAGYDVSVLAPLASDELMDDDAEILKGAPYKRIVSCDVRPSAGVGSTLGRGIRRLAHEGNRRLGLSLPEELGYGVRASLRKARALNADYYIGHQEVGAWVCWKLMREGRAVGADLEDWYSRDLLPENRAGRPVALLDRCEGDLVREARHVVTTSNAMADAMAEAYGRRPDVIYNAFPWTDRDSIDGLRNDRLDDDRPSLFWFSQTIGPGRGLEELVRALNHIESQVQLHLRGNADREYADHLGGLLKGGPYHTLIIHPLVSPKEILSRIVEHDIGFALEPAEPDNKDLTVSNKIFHYLQAGLAVVATPTAGQREVAMHAYGGVTLAGGEERDLAQAIQQLLLDRERLAQAKMNALKAARSVFCWEMESQKLLALVDRAINTPARP